MVTLYCSIIIMHWQNISHTGYEYYYHGFYFLAVSGITEGMVISGLLSVWIMFEQSKVAWIFRQLRNLYLFSVIILDRMGDQ